MNGNTQEFSTPTERISRLKYKPNISQCPFKDGKSYYFKSKIAIKNDLSLDPKLVWPSDGLMKTDIYHDVKDVHETTNTEEVRAYLKAGWKFLAVLKKRGESESDSQLLGWPNALPPVRPKDEEFEDPNRVGF